MDLGADMLTKEGVVVRVPARHDLSLAELFARLGLGEGNGGKVVRDFADVARPYDADADVQLYPINEDEATLHVLYLEQVKKQTHFTQLLTVHSLFNLAYEAKRNLTLLPQAFTGEIYAFGSAKAMEIEVPNREAGVMVKGIDIFTPVLYVENGFPRSSYSRKHSGGVGNSFVVFTRPAFLEE